MASNRHIYIILLLGSSNYFSRSSIETIVFQMANVRRISTEEVRVIFDCLKENKVPPEYLQFQIVPTGVSGMKLSPPPYEYQGKHFCGVYAHP